MHTSPVALITGVSRAMGLGYETARQLGQRGYHVLLTARHAAQADALARQLQQEGLSVTAHALDVCSDDSATQLAVAVAQHVGRLDVLINNAAVLLPAEDPAAPVDLPAAQQRFATNVFGPWRVVQALLPLLRHSPHGRIVNVSSGMGSFSDPVWGLTNSAQPTVNVYALTKLALNGLTAKLAKDLRADRILVNAVCPGFVATQPGFADYGARPVPEGAASIVWAATLPDDGPTGGFFRDGQPLGW
ncbi:SDR family NAD(P)-dependent oxidoreductase [Hymenobacter tibetensis]|uniref:SDR family NAD(P)-dependent oxidoreductase n=1 Tax=Hymenobacter tibetensis TaxID=497967 RepID=A0ABY4CTG3_9BACT|nr:SDR family NAD(P)-dependent oxidoreductase [Hymenobacter tibetensis]UOG73337.1 SDR family NAD(P)-dependent oxidoreductase [Hymenobacter tibetensis]